MGDSNLELVSDVISSRRRSISPEPHSCPRHVESRNGACPPIFHILKQHSGSDLIFLQSLYLDIKFFLCYLSTTLRGQGGNVRKLSRIDNQVHKQISNPKTQGTFSISKLLKVFFSFPSKYLNFPGNTLLLQEINHKI